MNFRSYFPRRIFAAVSVTGLAFAACGAPRSSDSSGPGADADGDDLVLGGDGQSGTGSAGGLCADDGTCTCIRLALLGTLDSKAADKDSSAFVAWLNGNSDGTVEVTLFDQKPNLDGAFLENYDILITANVNAWSFSAAEKEAVATWVQGGGGLLTLTGFTSEDSEPAQTSQLLEFSGLSYGKTKVAEHGENLPIYYQGGTENLRNCLVRNGVSSNDAVITTPIAFSSGPGVSGSIAAHLNYVGAFIGWEVVAPGEATVLAVDPTTSKPIAAAREFGEGRVVAFGDEWIVFANQWVAAGQPTNMQMDPYNPCWVSAEESPTGGPFFHSVSSLYQTKQFWYNAVSWLAPERECVFVVNDDGVIFK